MKLEKMLKNPSTSAAIKIAKCVIKDIKIGEKVICVSNNHPSFPLEKGRFYTVSKKLPSWVQLEEAPHDTLFCAERFVKKI